MRVQLDEDEVWALFSAVTRAVLDESGLADEDRGKLRRWRSEEMRVGREPFRVMQDKLNADLARVLKTKERSAIQKHDWV
ncbi:MAG: hypothetical protein U0531_16190 [Dehalococcoidia bacterium]